MNKNTLKKLLRETVKKILISELSVAQVKQQASRGAMTPGMNKKIEDFATLLQQLSQQGDARQSTFDSQLKAVPQAIASAAANQMSFLSLSKQLANAPDDQQVDPNSASIDNSKIEAAINNLCNNVIEKAKKGQVATAQQISQAIAKMMGSANE